MVGVMLVGVGLYFRPGQVKPRDAMRGASKAWVYWNCGPPDEDGVDGNIWSYDTVAPYFELVAVEFEGGKVIATKRFPVFVD